MADSKSFTARSWHDPLTGCVLLRLVSVDGGEDVQIADGLLLLRVIELEGGTVYRCIVRHIASGREIAIQGGSELRSFVGDCLLQPADQG